MPTLPAESSLVREKPESSGQYALLRGVPLFTALDDAAVDELFGYLHPMELKAGASLFRVGDAGDAMYIIESGHVRITVTDADGREVILASLGHGDFFGEMSMLDGHGRSADATVTEDSRLRVLTRDDFLNFVSSDSRIVLEMLSAITRRLRRTDDLLRHRVSRNANEEDAKNLTLADRAADQIARFGGSWKFIGASILFTLCWIAFNSALLHDKGFDAYPYVLLNLVIGMIASLSAPIIMMSQNREAQKDRLRADLDYQVNLKNEVLLAEILRLLEKREKDARTSDGSEE